MRLAIHLLRRKLMEDPSTYRCLGNALQYPTILYLKIYPSKIYRCTKLHKGLVQGEKGKRGKKGKRETGEKGKKGTRGKGEIFGGKGGKYVGEKNENLEISWKTGEKKRNKGKKGKRVRWQ